VHRVDCLRSVVSYLSTRTVLVVYRGASRLLAVQSGCTLPALYRALSHCEVIFVCGFCEITTYRAPWPVTDLR